MRARRSVKNRADRPRIFNLGLNKTGTSSFHQAMVILGFRSLHWGGPRVHELVEASFVAREPLLTNLHQRYDAFSDIGPLSRRFKLLDAQYPGSRFVLTVRPVEGWLESRRRHVESNVRLRDAGRYTGTFLVVDEEKWRRDWDTHLAQVRTYFAGRLDFLEIDMTDDPSWRPFCELLGVPEPDAAFPWDNRGREANSPTSRLRRLTGASRTRVRGGGTADRR
jgi:Sulfotransferase domain